MAIKMRNNTNPYAICCECGDNQSDVLNMFDFCINGTIFTICDECNQKILDKCLKAEVLKNGRVKTPRDLAVIRNRRTR